MDNTDEAIMANRLRWELYINAYIDLMQISVQIVLYVISSSLFWIFLIPHCLSIISIFAFFTINGQQYNSIISAVLHSVTLSTDMVLLLILVYAVIECAFSGKTTYTISSLFGFNICQGPTFDGGLVELICVLFVLASFWLQATQLTNLDKYIQYRHHWPGGLSYAVISIVMYLFTITFLLYREKYLFFALELFSCISAIITITMHFLTLLTKYSSTKIKTFHNLEVLFFVLALLAAIVVGSFLLVDAVYQCRNVPLPSSLTINFQNQMDCTIQNTATAAFFFIILILRSIIFFLMTMQTSKKLLKTTYKLSR